MWHANAGLYIVFIFISFSGWPLRFSVSGPERHSEMKYVKPNQIMFIKRDSWMMNGGREHRCFHCTTGRQQQAGDTVNRPSNNTVFSHVVPLPPTSITASASHCVRSNTVTEQSTFLSLKKNTRINYVWFWGERRGSTWCHQMRNSHLTRIRYRTLYSIN